MQRIGFISLRCLSRRYSTVRPSHLTILGESHPTDSTTNVPPSILDKLPLKLHTRPSHPLCILRHLIEAQFPLFKHISSLSPLVTPYKNFDELSFPHDHPGRSVTDSYYINKNLMLRTHTSAHEVEVFKQGDTKWLLTADVYRRDEIDGSHYPVFHQMEGASIFSADASGMQQVEEDNARLSAILDRSNIVIEDIPHITPSNPCQPSHNLQYSELVAMNLKLSLNSMILGLFSQAAGATKSEPLRVRWIEAYFPFTSPSYEVEVFFRGKWLEILGCGVVRQATLDRANVPDKMGWAFGLGLERIAMVLFSIPDIRLFWSQDPRFANQFTEGKVSEFKLFSKYPPIWKDISFWTAPNASFHENDFCDLVRDTAGDVVEDVECIDEFIHPKTERRSLCYRVQYRSMDRSLSHEEINKIHVDVTTNLQNQFRVEIR